VKRWHDDGESNKNKEQHGKKEWMMT